jgi:DNA-binding SARP family transcriptional activator
VTTAGTVLESVIALGAPAADRTIRRRARPHRPGGIDMARVQPARSRAAPQWNIALLDAFHLARGRSEIPLHRREQRLVALIALQGGRPRGYLAGVLWPESTEKRATGNLRAALWRADRQAPGLLVHDRAGVRFDGAVRVDTEALNRCSARIAAWRQAPGAIDRKACLRTLPVLLRGDLLPGWYDDWVIYERARLAQQRLHALQAVADLFIQLGRVPEALVAASTAVSIEPLHEPAIRSLVRAEIEDGDFSGALRDYDDYRARVLSELGVPPSQRLDALVRPLLQARRRRASVVA